MALNESNVRNKNRGALKVVYQAIVNTGPTGISIDKLMATIPDLDDRGIRNAVARLQKKQVLTSPMRGVYVANGKPLVDAETTSEGPRLVTDNDIISMLELLAPGGIKPSAFPAVMVWVQATRDLLEKLA